MLPLLLLFLILDNPAQLVQRGMAALDANNLSEARASFAGASKLAPTHAGIWMMLAQTCAKLGDRKAAQDAAANAERFGSKDPAILQGLTNYYAGAIHDLPRAASFGARYAELVPQDSTAWQRVAAMYLEARMPDQAIAAGLKGEAKDSSAELAMLLGRAYAERKDWAKSDAQFAEAVRANPYDENVRFAAAQVHLLRLDFVGAAQVLLDARKVFDKSPQLELMLGVAYYGERKFSKAVDQFLLTMRLSPDLPQPYAFLGRILEHAGDRLPEVAERAASFEERNPGDALGYLLHAKVLLAQSHGEFSPEALALVEKSVSLNENDADAQLQLGSLLYRKGDSRGALNHLEKSAELNAKDSAVHFQLARVYNSLGRKEDAARERALHEKLAGQENAAPGLERKP